MASTYQTPAVQPQSVVVTAWKKFTTGLLMKRIECFGMYGISVTERSQRTRMAWLGWAAGL